MDKRKVVIATICAAAAIGVISVGAALFTKSGITLPFIERFGSSDAGEAGDGTASYILETSYDGTNPVDKALFQIPFKKTDDYIQNKDLVAKDKKMVQDLEKRAEDFIKAMLGTGYREVDTEGFSYKDTMCDYIWEPENTLFMLDDGTELLASDYFEDFGEYISEHQIQADVTFETDDSLVYADGYYYVRGKLTITPYSFTGEETEESNLVPEGILLSAENTTIFEISLKSMAHETDDYYYVTGFNRLADF